LAIAGKGEHVCTLVEEENLEPGLKDGGMNEMGEFDCPSILAEVFAYVSAARFELNISPYVISLKQSIVLLPLVR
jgi:hypothetical protein